MIQKTIDFLVSKTQKRKNIYIVPTAFGFIYAGVTFSIFLIALTYTNNVTLIIAFWLLTVFLIQMLKTHKEVKSINILDFKLSHSYAHENLNYTLKLSGTPQTTKIKLIIEKQFIDLKQNNLLKRGAYKADELLIENYGSYSLFYCWKFHHVDEELIVYPKRVHYNIDHILNDGKARTHSSDDEFSLHIPYHSSLTAKRINWRVYAKNQQLYWKKFETHENNPEKLSLDSVKGDLETKIEKIAFIILYLNRINTPWSLKLPSQNITVSLGSDHLHYCLEKLARL